MFINFNTNQTNLPIDLATYLEPDHIVFHIYNFVHSLDSSYFEMFRTTNGRPAYHPKAILMALLYAYSEGTFSGRKIEKMMKENIPMQWLVGQQIISYRTINRFRSTDSCRQLIQTLFIEWSYLLKKEKLITMDHCFIDGTKIEANANRYSFVWKKAVQKYNERLKQTIQAYYLEEIQPLVDLGIKEDQMEPIDEPLLRHFLATLEENIETINHSIEDQPVRGVDARKTRRRRLKKHHRRVSLDFLPRLIQYKNYLDTLGNRNSFSKTDHDATFMRMKDDHMMNGQLKAGYNLQIATENQFVLHYDVFPNPTDTRTFIPFIESCPFSFKTIIADAGYGSEENLTYLDQHQIQHLIKYGTYDKEQRKKFLQSDKNLKNWKKDKENRWFIHPNGMKYLYAYTSKKRNTRSYEKTVDVFKAAQPEIAPQKALYYNAHYEQLKEKTNEKLLSPKGRKLFSKRKIDVEPVFGQIKACLGYTRCHLRGKSKVKTEMGLVLMANNIKKYAKIIQNK